MRAAPRWPALALVLTIGGACSDGGPSTVELTERRTASRPSNAVLPGATAQQRFETPRAPEREASDEDPFEYDLPEGWTVVAPTRDRYVNLRPAGDPEAECYLSFLSGSGGGLEENVNRWRNQLGAAPLGSAEVAALPRHPLLGRQATVVEAEGTFSAMGGPARAGFKLVGLIVSEPGGSLFLKFIAPAGVVELEREQFLAFASSLRLAAGHGDANGAADPHEHVEQEARAGETPSEEKQLSTLTWKAPDGWVEQPARRMREVTFALPENAECYVARLGGDAGGLRMNLDRWCGQFGRAPLSEEAFAQLERVAMLGESVPVLELAGSFTGMDGVERAGQAMLGVACIRGHESLFVKLTGPQDVVAAQRASFLAFVRSLEERS